MFTQSRIIGEVDAKAKGDWRFDARRAEHVSRQGDRIPLADMRAVYDEQVGLFRERMRETAQRYNDGKIDLATLEREMRSDVRALHLQGRILGAGGRPEMTQSEWGRTGWKLRQEYGYLSGFIRDVEDGRMSAAGIVDRASKYAGSSAVDQFEEARRGAMQKAGYSEKRRVAINDEGTCSVCRDEAARGWVPIDEPGFRIGHTQCQSRDRCTIEYRRGQTPDATDRAVAAQNDRQIAIEAVDAAEFAAALKTAHNSHKAFVSPQSERNLIEMEARCFLTESGDAGYYMRPDGYVGGLFNGGKVKGVGHNLLLHAVESGATSLDCFDGYLSSRYSEYGFKVVARYTWDDEFTPPGWDVDRYNRPDYVDMAWDGGDRWTVYERHRSGVPLREEA